MRTVPEWVASRDDEAIPQRVRLRIWEREGGRCSLTGRKIMPGDAYDYEHRIALCNGGQHREANIVLALRDKHREKTADDLALKKKIARTRAKHLGIWPQSRAKIKSRGFQKSRPPVEQKPIGSAREPSEDGQQKMTPNTFRITK
jgi:5-methylcytosine-specific restriction protein A